MPITLHIPLLDIPFPEEIRDALISAAYGTKVTADSWRRYEILLKALECANRPFLEYKDTALKFLTRSARRPKDENNRKGALVYDFKNVPKRRLNGPKIPAETTILNYICENHLDLWAIRSFFFDGLGEIKDENMLNHIGSVRYGKNNCYGRIRDPEEIRLILDRQGILPRVDARLVRLIPELVWQPRLLSEPALVQAQTALLPAGT